MDEKLKNYLLERLRKGFEECNIPGYMRGGLERYLVEGIEPGGFLMAVLENDFKGAVARADRTNQVYLVNYGQLLYNFLPRDAHGSPEKVKAWIRQFERKTAYPPTDSWGDGSGDYSGSGAP